jgi:hypothetical protein
MASGCSTVVEHSPRHPMDEGSNLAAYKKNYRAKLRLGSSCLVSIEALLVTYCTCLGILHYVTKMTSW